jgi:hypothetical protein
MRVANIQGSYEKGDRGTFRRGGYLVLQEGRNATVEGPGGSVTKLVLMTYDGGHVLDVDGKRAGNFEVENVQSGLVILRFSNGTTLVKVSNCG